MTALTPERWPRIQALFATLTDAPDDVRAPALAAAAAEDPEVAAIVAGMLAQADAPDRLQAAIAGVASTLEAGPGAPPARFGRYRTGREIGRGGMGVVYEGVSDDEFARRVAIKVAPLARLGASADARFRLERQILASLDHPHIARFLDGGTEDGLPYFVMEFVEGVPITAYVTARALPLAERLRLVQRLCGALHYAHQRLVVHRDLKPSNILVASDGTPKLLDFGVAKLLDTAEPGQPTLGALAWTPDYASPEQVSGDLIGTPSDIYSLGLVLYEILTGTRAQATDTTAPLAIARAVCDTVPPRPSERVAAGGDAVLARRLRGDLDTIVMTAVHKDPARRYGSAAALADDIERYLTGKPVEAHPASAWYRARKALARHRGTVVAASLLAVAVIAGLVSTAYQARRADRRFQQVRALANEFVFGMHDRIATLPGATEARRALVQTALTYLENLREDASDDPVLARELAAAYVKVGRVQGHPLEANLGEPKAAAASFARARELLTPLEATGDAGARLALARLELQVASLQRSQGDTAGAERGLARALALAEQLRAANPRDEGALEVIGEGNADLARASDDPATVEAAARRALEAAAAVLALTPNDARRQDDVATAHGAVGRAHLNSGRIEAAAASFGRAVAIREALVQAAPGNTQWRRGLAVALGNLGDVLGGRTGGNLDDVTGAARAMERAVAICREMLASDPQDRRAAFDLVNALSRLGALLADVPERSAEALAVLEEAHRRNAALMAADVNSSRYARLQLFVERRLGRAYRVAGRRTDAEAVLRHARRVGPGFVAGDTNTRLNVAVAGVELALLLAERGDGQALTLGSAVAAELEADLQSPGTEALAHADLGRAFLLLARHAPRPARRDEAGHPAHLALAQFQSSADLWQRATLPPQLTTQRERALAELAANRGAAAALVSR